MDAPPPVLPPVPADDPLPPQPPPRQPQFASSFVTITQLPFAQIPYNHRIALLEACEQAEDKVLSEDGWSSVMDALVQQMISRVEVESELSVSIQVQGQGDVRTWGRGSREVDGSIKWEDTRIQVQIRDWYTTKMGVYDSKVGNYKPDKVAVLIVKGRDRRWRHLIGLLGETKGFGKDGLWMVAVSRTMLYMISGYELSGSWLGMYQVWNGFSRCFNLGPSTGVNPKYPIAIECPDEVIDRYRSQARFANGRPINMPSAEFISDPNNHIAAHSIWHTTPVPGQPYSKTTLDIPGTQIYLDTYALAIHNLLLTQVDGIPLPPIPHSDRLRQVIHDISGSLVHLADNEDKERFDMVAKARSDIEYRAPNVPGSVRKAKAGSTGKQTPSPRSPSARLLEKARTAAGGGGGGVQQGGTGGSGRGRGGGSGTRQHRDGEESTPALLAEENSDNSQDMSDISFLDIHPDSPNNPLPPNPFLPTEMRNLQPTHHDKHILPFSLDHIRPFPSHVRPPSSPSTVDSTHKITNDTSTTQRPRSISLGLPEPSELSYINVTSRKGFSNGPLDQRRLTPAALEDLAYENEQKTTGGGMKCLGNTKVYNANGATSDVSEADTDKGDEDWKAEDWAGLLDAMGINVLLISTAQADELVKAGLSEMDGRASA